MDGFLELLRNIPSEEKRLDLTYWRCAVDVELFTLLYFPHYVEYSFNEFHYSKFAAWGYGERGIKRADGAPRGYAKSTLVALIKPIHDLCYGLENFVVIISNTKPQATGKIRDIRNELLNNNLLVEYYGIQFLNKNPGESQFIVDANGHQTMFMAAGSGTQIRGVRFNQHRPTKIILDDVEHSEEVFNEEIRNKHRNWFFEDVCKAGSKKTNIEFVGTVLHPKALLIDLCNNPAYESRQIHKSVISWSEREDLWDQWKQIMLDLEDDERESKADAFYEANKEEMLKGTKVLWSENESYLDLMKELLEIGRRAFMKEKQNAPLGADDAVFDRETFHWYREVKEGLFIEKSQSLIPWKDLLPFGVMDPSTGQTKAKKGKLGDYTCLLTGYKDPHGRLLVHSDWTRRSSPTKYIQEVFEHHLRYGFEKFGVETNLYRNLLLPNIVKERERQEQELGRKLKIPFYDIENTDNKEKRIYTLEPKVNHGWIVFNRSLSGEFMSQIEEFPHADHDDCPDALEMLYGLANNRYKVSQISTDPMGAR